ncbi:MAG TPA: T9SS type A sorting domain-containing protein, partial [bacterium]
DGSPCIDAGNPDPAYNDLDGSRNDMGAFGGPFADTTGFLGRQVAVALVEPQYQSGDTLCIPVTATSVQGISNIEMKVEYNDSHLRLLAIRHGEITQPFSLSEIQESPGITSLRLSSSLFIRQNSGSICELIAQVQTITDTATVIRLNDLIFKDQVDNVYAAAPVEGHIKITAVKSENKGQNLVPDQFALLQNYPNPFNPTTIIRFDLPKTSRISLKIYNLLGQEIYTLYEGMKSAGNHQAIWDGKDNHDMAMPSGLYFCRLSVEGGRWVQTIKIMLIR